MIVNERLTGIRQSMRQVGIDYYYVPAADPHQNEYVPPRWQRRRWLTGFTGSAGDALIGAEKAYLWTDPRYTIQAKQQLDVHQFELMTMSQGMAPPIHEWLAEHGADKVIGVDPQVITMRQASLMQEALESVGGKLVPLVNNFIDQLWEDVPSLTSAPIRILDDQYTGQSTVKKLATMRQHLKQAGCVATIVTALDAIAWVLNIRGDDVKYNPLVISYIIITNDDVMLFIESSKVSDAQRKQLEDQGVSIHSYETFADMAHQLQGRVMLDDSVTSWWVTQQLAQAKVVNKASPITLMKACKNDVELKNTTEAHRIDGVALVKFIHWLEQHWQEGYNEYELGEKLLAYRQQHPDSIGPSFTTISAFAGNGAICHYDPRPETALLVDDSDMYLLDSGGQYLTGTTDVTRTMHFGMPKPEHIKYYTLVLKGHLALARLVFPDGTCGEHIDIIARQYLWQDHVNYGHGTGHGVGVFLCVHEGPQRISPGQTRVPLKPGMIVSNEPGIYFSDDFGIRIENLCKVIQVASSNPIDHIPYFGFEDLTLVPYNRKLIDLGLLTQEEITQVNEYHARVKRCLYDDLDASEQVWLDAATAPL